MNPHDRSTSKARIRHRFGTRLLVAFMISSTLIAAFAMWQAPRAKARSGRSDTHYGQAQPVGAGSARSYLTLEDGLPVEIGFELSEDALRALPPGMKWMPGHEHIMTEYLLDLPEQASVTPFQFLELDWNAGGHEPPGIYDQPHFDFHFFTISRAERLAIDPAVPDYTRKAEHLPKRELIPAGYFTPSPIMAVPRMGVHWVNTQADELNGKPFTQTFIRGSWGGRMVFYEPMITKAFLESKPDVTLPIAAAACYEPVGYHPSTYGIRYDPDKRHYRVSLGGFSYRGCDVLDTTLRPLHRP